MTDVLHTESRYTLWVDEDTGETISGEKYWWDGKTDSELIFTSFIVVIMLLSISLGENVFLL